MYRDKYVGMVFMQTKKRTEEILIHSVNIAEVNRIFLRNCFYHTRLKFMLQTFQNPTLLYIALTNKLKRTF